MFNVRAALGFVCLTSRPHRTLPFQDDAGGGAFACLPQAVDGQVCTVACCLDAASTADRPWRGDSALRPACRDADSHFGCAKLLLSGHDAENATTGIAGEPR